MESTEQSAPIEAPVVEEAAPVEEQAAPKVEFTPEVLMQKVETLAKENKKLLRKSQDLETSQSAMAKQFQTMVESTVSQRVAELMASRDEAIDVGDRQKVREIDQQIKQVENAKAQVQPGPPKVDSAIADFVEANSEWFNKDPEMTEFAIAFNESYLKRNPNDLEKSLEVTLEKVKKAFPDKFKQEEEKRTPPSPVEGTAKATANNKYSLGRLNNEQKMVYEQFVKRHKIMSHDEYFKSLDEAGYLE